MRDLESRIKRILRITSKVEPKDKRRKSIFSYINPEAVLVLLEEGTRVKEIAKIYGCKTDTLKYQMRKKGYDFDGRVFYQRRDISIEDVVKLHKKGLSIREIARKYNTSLETITERLREAGILAFPKRVELDEEDEKNIVDLYCSGLSREEVSRRTGYTSYVVKKVLRDKGVKERSHRRVDVPKREAVRMYRKIRSIKRVAIEYNTSRHTIERILSKAGVSISRTSINLQRREDIPIEEVTRLYGQGKTTREIASLYKCSPTTVVSRLREAGILLKEGQGMVREDLPREEIRKEYKKGATISSLSREYDCCWKTIKNIVEK